MARRASAVSTNSLAPLKSNVESIQSTSYLNASASNANGQMRLPPRTPSVSGNTVPKHYNENVSLDPGELFTQRTVVEVKAVQLQLRADADAKQEELRLMVGERYRDLLQASTSIISIASSSKRVIEALAETKETILAQEEPPLPKRASLVSKEDAHLQTLQILSAHIKLLLDAPEHLWRLIERKKYFQAAWLFLLARVVHRALVRDDDQDEESWGNQGIDVMEQFPLVQRQWDAVSHFRAQIIHKAMLSLRIYTAPQEETCATLLTLHLLDSKPLIETLSVLLAQRSKTLHTSLSKNPESQGLTGSNSPGPRNRQTNGHPPEHKTQAKSPKRRIREVRQATEVALDTISRTLTTSRNIFQDDPSSHRSMITGILEYIQSDSSNTTTTHALPTELLLTTQTLLTTLPSSAHFLLLPPNLRSYKPYVDLTSSSSSMPQQRFIQRLDEWYKHACKKLQETVETWFSGLETIKEVWRIRVWIRKWIVTTSRLEEHEQKYLKNMFDDVSRQRMATIWKAVLANAEKDFRDKLSSSISSLTEGSYSATPDSSTVDNLFTASPLPAVSQLGSGNSLVGSSFQKYKSALQRQISGRTISLDDVLSPLEHRAKAMQDDFSQAAVGEAEDSRTMADQLREVYRPDADKLCSAVINTLESAAESYIDSPGDTMNSLTFIGRVADELSSSSSFVSTIGCGSNMAEDFRAKTAALHARIISRWRKETVSRVVTRYWTSLRPASQNVTPGSLSIYPSTAVIQSLLSLSTSIQHLGISRDPPRLGYIANDTLRLFVVELLNDAEDQPTGWKLDTRQALCDLAFLRKFADLWVDGWTKPSGLLDERIGQLQEKLRPQDTSTLDATIAECFSRTQVLLAALLPLAPVPKTTPPSKDSHEKMAALLSYGVPNSEMQFQPALELAKPSARFGLLLIGGTAGH